MKTLTQARCNAIARKLNNRPRERYDFLTPLERLEELLETQPLPKSTETPPRGRHPLLDPPPSRGRRRNNGTEEGLLQEEGAIENKKEK